MPSPVLDTAPRPCCYLCGTEGVPLYQDLVDHLFAVPGQWQLKRCPSSECGLVWLDPMPLKEELTKAYHHYLQRKPQASSDGFLSSLGSQLQRRINRLLLALTGIRTQRLRARTLFLDDCQPGRVLDLGCGSGELLHQLHQRGWEVEGIDFNPDAVQRARENFGFTVHAGALSAMNYPDNYFDAVTLKHVIEHLSEPIATLIECRRILKTGERLVMMTPNIQSWGHRHFQRAWRGLEPPRHLFLFSCRTLAQAAQRAGFEQIETFTTVRGAESILTSSRAIQRMSRRQAPARSALLSSAWLLPYYELWLLRQQPELGEEVVLVARKSEERSTRHRTNLPDPSGVPVGHQAQPMDVSPDDAGGATGKRSVTMVPCPG
jgi:SAM-dependent methyltransferase